MNLIEEFVQDLQILTQSNLSVKEAPLLITAHYRQALYKYLSDLSVLQADIDIQNKEFAREKKLYAKKIITQADFDKVNYTFKMHLCVTNRPKTRNFPHGKMNLPITGCVSFH